MPAPELSLAQYGPSILPQPAAPDVVDPLGSSGGEFGVPEAYAASLPNVTPPQSPSAFSDSLPVSPPGSPYYFIGEASPYAQSGGLPGQGELLAQLTDIGRDRKSDDSNDHGNRGWPQGRPQ